nr:hypothetical protein P5626_21105 [Bacillus subtilis]WGD66063.1 hypothetical protein P5652_01320 [Bacillus subtilis]
MSGSANEILTARSCSLFPPDMAAAVTAAESSPTVSDLQFCGWGEGGFIFLCEQLINKRNILLRKRHVGCFDVINQLIGTFCSRD